MTVILGKNWKADERAAVPANLLHVTNGLEGGVQLRGQDNVLLARFHQGLTISS